MYAAAGQRDLHQGGGGSETRVRTAHGLAVRGEAGGSETWVRAAHGLAIWGEAGTTRLSLWSIVFWSGSLVD